MTVAHVGTRYDTRSKEPYDTRTVATDIGGHSQSDLTVKGECLVLFAWPSFFHPGADKDSPYPTRWWPSAGHPKVVRMTAAPVDDYAFPKRGKMFAFFP